MKPIARMDFTAPKGAKEKPGVKRSETPGNPPQHRSNTAKGGGNVSRKRTRSGPPSPLVRGFVFWRWPYPEFRCALLRALLLRTLPGACDFPCHQRRDGPCNMGFRNHASSARSQGPQKRDYTTGVKRRVHLSARCRSDLTSGSEFKHIAAVMRLAAESGVFRITSGSAGDLLSPPLRIET